MALSYIGLVLKSFITIWLTPKVNNVWNGKDQTLNTDHVWYEYIFYFYDNSTLVVHTNKLFKQVHLTTYFSKENKRWFTYSITDRSVVSNATYHASIDKWSMHS